MPDDPKPPIDYFNPLASAQPPQPRPPIGPPPAAVVPVEFDRVLSKSADHGAIVAVEAALRANKIVPFRADDGQVVGREVTLYVRGDDYERAAPIAAAIFARRSRIKSLPRQEMLKDKKGPAGQMVMAPRRRMEA